MEQRVKKKLEFRHMENTIQSQNGKFKQLMVYLSSLLTNEKHVSQQLMSYFSEGLKAFKFKEKKIEP